jgi:flagellar hook assembly protein FlgD
MIFPDYVNITFPFGVSGNGSIVLSTPKFANGQLPTITDPKKSLSIYWFNGVNWIKLGTTADMTNNNISVKSRLAGSYQLRLVDQANIQNNSVYPKTITPNGDGINDVAFFLFENKTGAVAQGTIYDLRSAKVADLQESNIFAGDNSVLTWDGKDNSGSVVPAGVYIYKVKVADMTYTGTVIVAR